MPRLTAIKAEVGTSGVIERLDITGDAAEDVSDAVRMEHYSDSCAGVCDIHEANEVADCPFTAAWLLQGATETPLLDAVLAHYGIDFRDFPQDFDQWKEHHDRYGVECDSCGSFTFADDLWTPESCGNCGAALEQEEEADAA